MDAVLILTLSILNNSNYYAGLLLFSTAPLATQHSSLAGNYTSESCAMRLLNPSRNLWKNKPQRPPVSAQPLTSLAKSQKQVLLQHQRFISLEHW